MTYKALTKRLAVETGVSEKQVRAFLGNFAAKVRQVVRAGGEVAISHFGRFVQREATTTYSGFGETVDEYHVPARVAFRAFADSILSSKGKVKKTA